MNIQQVIQLDTLIPKTNAEMLLQLPPETTTHVDSHIAGCNFVFFNSYGSPRLWFSIQGSRLLAGQLILGYFSIQVGGTPQTIMVNGQVGDNAPASFHNSPLCLRSSNFRLFCQSYIELNAQTFRPFLSNADQIFGAGSLLILSLDKQGQHYGIINLGEALPNVHYNQAPLQKWSRAVLQPHHQISLDRLNFVVEAGAKPILKTNLSTLDFGKLSEGKTVSVTLQNQSSQAAKVQVIPIASWLEVSQQDFQLAPQQSVTLQVTPTATHALNLGICNDHSALWLVVNQAELLPLSATLNVDHLPVIPSIEPRILKFPNVTQGAVAGQSVAFTLKNEGNSPWQATIDPTVPWLTAQPGGSFVVPPLGTVAGQLTTTSLANQLPVGIPPNLTMQVTGNAQLTARVVLNVQQPVIQLKLAPLQFGDYPRQGTKTKMVTTITNTGQFPFQGELRSRANWLTLTSPTHITLAPNESIPVEAMLNAQADQLPDGLERDMQALELKSHQFSWFLIAEINVVAGKPSTPNNPTGTIISPPPLSPISIDPQQVDWGQYTGGASPSEVIFLKNTTASPVTFRIRSQVFWLTVSESKVTVNPQETGQFIIELMPHLAVRAYHHAQAIMVETDAVSAAVSVSVEVRHGKDSSTLNSLFSI